MSEYSIVFNFMDSSLEERFINDIKNEYTNCEYSVFSFSVIDIKTNGGHEYLLEYIRSVVKNYIFFPSDGIIIYTSDEVFKPCFDPYECGLLIVGEKRKFIDGVKDSIGRITTGI